MKIILRPLFLSICYFFNGNKGIRMSFDFICDHQPQPSSEVFLQFPFKSYLTHVQRLVFFSFHPSDSTMGGDGNCSVVLVTSDFPILSLSHNVGLQVPKFSNIQVPKVVFGKPHDPLFPQKLLAGIQSQKIIQNTKIDKKITFFSTQL